MAEQLPDREDGEHPIVAGLLALVGVGLAVGLLLGIVVVMGTKVVGLGNGSGDGSGGSQATLYIPTPAKTTGASGPQVTLTPQSGGATTPSAPDTEPSSSESTDRQITLAASTTSVSPMEQFELTGIYQQGEGAILTVQRFESGHWAEFPATGSVSGSTFQIPVQTSRSGVNRFRVVDTDAHVHSDEVRITVTG